MAATTTLVSSFSFYDNGTELIPSMPVNPASAIAIPAFYRGLRFIASTCASLPAVVVKREGKDLTTPVLKHPVNALLNRQASPGVLAFTVRETWAMHAAGTGNGYIRVNRDKRGALVSLRTTPSAAVRPFIVDPVGEKFFQVDRPGQKPEILLSNDIAHLSLPSWDGVKGLNPILALPGTFDLATLADSFTRKYLRQAGHLEGYVEFPMGTTEDQIAAAKAHWKGLKGLDNVGGTAFLNGGKYVSLTKGNNEAQLTELRRQIIADIAAILCIPPRLLYVILDDKGGGDIAALIVEALTFGLRNWIEFMEAELAATLLTPAEQDADLEIDLEIDGIMRGDPIARSGLVNALVNAGLLTVNEGRAFLGRARMTDAKYDTLREPVAVSQVPKDGGEPKPEGISPGLAEGMGAGGATSDK